MRDESSAAAEGLARITAAGTAEGRLLPRRAIVERLPVAGLAGMTAMLLPSAAAAASPDVGIASATSPASLTIDDTVAPDEGDEVAYLVTLRESNDEAFIGTATVTIEVTVDDGANGGDGSPADGTRISGQVRSVATSTAVLGRTRFSVRFPSAGTFLMRFTTSPSTVAHPDGVTVFRIVT